MALIRANRESIDDRFSVLGFTVRTDTPLFEIGLATDPELLKGENSARRSRNNFFSSRLLGATRTRDGESVYLVPPSVVARFAGQPRLYFGLATYQDNDRLRPVHVRIPDRGNMYVSLSGLTERGLRRTSMRVDTGTSSYGSGGEGLQWGGDVLTSAAPAKPSGNGVAAAPSEPAPYSDGYSDELWKQNETPAARAPAATAPSSAVPAVNGTAPALAPAPVNAQSYTYAPLSRPLLVERYYQPTGWWDALTSQISFFVQGALWFLGVSDTTVPPHSAICQIRRPDGSAEGALHGSGFFIGPRLILTAAHVVDGQSDLIVVPGKNGGGVSTTTEPFGRFRVSSSNFSKHPSYRSGNSDFDMALICVPPANAVAAPNYFDLVEELTQSRPEGVVVCGYAARWYADDAVEHFVNDNIDPNRQHLHGGYIRTLPSEETFDYDLQTLGGTSGSPVYWIEGGAQPRAHMVGVHVAAHSETTNLGCRITPAKLQWIRSTATAWGQTLTFSLGARAFDAAPVAKPVPTLPTDEVDPDAFGITEDEPIEGELAVAQALRARGLDVPTPDYPGASRFAPAHPNNYRHGRRTDRVVDRIVIHITAGGPSINGTIAWFQNGDRPNRSSAHYIVGRDGEVVQMVRNADTAYHASAANSRSIGIEHNANKPSRRNSRDLPPTEPQYEASARLVAWLCQQYAIPADREHIRGHQEISPGDNHECPSSIWDWDHYMTCVQLAVSQLASGQSTRALRAVSRGLEIISPFYDPADPASALTCQNDAFSLAREEWFVGVPNTSIFPHSAICQLNMTAPDGTQYSGTGFYIGRNRILTCAHNLQGMSRCEIIPARNGAGASTAVRPFGSTTVTSSSWRIAPRYSGSGDWDNDLAVIDNVSIAAPGGAYFEFLHATPSTELPVVVCGYSAASRKVPQLDYIIDGDKQHLHGGYVSDAPTADTIDYPILSLMGASGSPVYTLTGSGRSLAAKICAVHVSGEPADRGLNRGCFITPSKIDWIEGRATTFALGATASALIIGPEDVERAQRYAPRWADLFNWTVPSQINTALSARGMSVQRIQDAIGELNLDRYEVHCTALPSGWTDTSLLEHLRTHLNDFLDTRNSEFIPYTMGTDDVAWGSGSPVGAVFKIDIVGPDNASVVGSLVEPHRWRFTTVNAPWSGDHPVSGHREFGVRNEGGTTVFYTRGADRSTQGMGETMVFAGAHHLWLSFQQKLTDWVNANGGRATAPTPFSERFHPEVVRILYGATTQSLGARGLEAADEDSAHGIEGPIPDDVATAQSLAAIGRALTAPTPEYAQASRFVPAATGNYRASASARTIERVVIHITDGGANINGTIGWFQNPAAKVSAHYVIGQDGEVVQMVRHNDVAWHARSANRTSIGIEHVANTRGLAPTPAQLCASAALVSWLCDTYSIPVDRTHILGHSEADTATTHTGCPNAVWNWTHYMGLVTSRSCYAPDAATAQSLGVRALAGEADYPVPLIPQPDKNSCWAAAMAMLLSYRRSLSLTPEMLAADIGASLATSYNWDLLNAVRGRYGFEVIPQPSNASLYHSPQQWADWLAAHGPLWVVIVGQPHAVVLAGIRGNLADPASVQVRILNPWDTRVAFDTDPIAFRPANTGYADWLSFNQFASDFGNMAVANYGNWRVLYLPATAAAAQSLAYTRARPSRLVPPPPAISLDISNVGLPGPGTPGEAREPIEPSRVAGTRMHALRGRAGGCTWALDQLEGLKSPSTMNPSVSSALPTDVTIVINDWPAIDGAPCPLPLTLTFKASQGSVGDVRISAGMPANLAYGVDACARIEDSSDVGAVAVLKVVIDCRFSGLAQGNPAARIELRLLGDGRYERENRWVETTLAA